MSGPKGYNAVLAERLRRERELAARRRRWADLVRQADSADARAARIGTRTGCRAALRDAGFPPSRVARPSEQDLDRIDAFAAHVAAAVADSRRAANAALAAEVGGALGPLKVVLDDIDADPLASPASAPGSRNIVRSAAANLEPPPSDPEPVGHARKRARELLAALPETGDRRDGLAAAIAQAVQDEADERTWLSLAAEVSDAVRAEKNRIAHSVLADALHSRTARIEDPADRARVAAMIDAADSLAALQGAEPGIVAAATEAERRDERRFILTQAAEVWEELGYEVDTDFVETTLAGEPALLHHKGWSRHALQVRFATDREEIATNVVALGETSAERDREVEEEHCSEAAGFASALGSRGVDTTRVRAITAGTLPMQHLTLPDAPGEQRRTGRAVGTGQLGTRTGGASR